ncbi:MAG: hypothetical protein J6U57_00730, partial [Bacteroidales bacterium]|nr:hypothetical protein [Bacteroidales bacterium]
RLQIAKKSKIALRKPNAPRLQTATKSKIAIRSKTALRKPNAPRLQIATKSKIAKKLQLVPNVEFKNE